MAGFFQAITGIFSGRPGAPPDNAGSQGVGPVSSTAASAAPVNFDTAMQVSAVWAAVRLISECIASLPFDVYKVGPNGRAPASIPVRDILTRNPNQYQTTVEFWESMLLNLVISGNAYAIKQMSGGRIVGLLPVSSQQIETVLLSDGSVVHNYRTGSRIQVLSSDSVWHVRLFGNAFVGMSPLSFACNSIGIAIATDNRVTKIFKSGGKPTGILSLDKALKSEQREEIRQNFAGLSAGETDGLFVFEHGMKFTQVSLSPQDIQLLDSRRFQIEDIGRFFGVPSILLNQSVGGSGVGSTVNEIITAFYKLNLRPYLEKIESSVVRWLTPNDGTYEAAFDFDALLRSDVLTRMQAYREAINSGQLMPNEARAMEGRNAQPGGDRLYIQGAMVPAARLGSVANES